ncbi:MAG: outer membrane protein transport protein [Flavobacteriaceae bacterium]|nr:outer membrane protein transport protein [Flavobacteriaceae bacterium]
MKKIILFVTLVAVNFTAQSQALGYEDLSILFSRDDGNGSARFISMGGAFGALGGDVSSMTINPAGISVFNGSHASIAFQARSTEYLTNYYGSSITTQEDYFRIANAGAVISFDAGGNGEWTKIALGVNYRILTDFDNTFVASGNSGFASFDSFPLDNSTTPIVYNVAENQQFTNIYNGEISELNLGFSGEYQGKLHVGAGINFYDLNFSQRGILYETNNDGNGNTLDARFYQENFTTGTGFSLSAGFIYKPSNAFRFGFSYQSPTWFTEILEESNITNNDGFFGDTEIEVSNDNVIYDNTVGGNLPFQSFIYKLKTPSKLTASAAIIFGKTGLISLDYSRRNYQGLNLSGDNFSVENSFFDNQLRTTTSLNVGTEWRFNQLSIRGGLKFEESPDANALNTDNVEGYSLGIGYNFGNFKIDLAMSNNNRTGIYNFYPQYSSQVNAADVKIDNSILTAGISISL